MSVWAYSEEVSLGRLNVVLHNGRKSEHCAVEQTTMKISLTPIMLISAVGVCCGLYSMGWDQCLMCSPNVSAGMTLRRRCIRNDQCIQGQM